MKKQILTLVMMLSIMNMLPAKAETMNQETSCIRPPKIHIVIVFGKPKYDCEVYPGICLFLYGTFDKSNPLSGGTYVSYENNDLQIEIQKNEISEELSNKLNENKIFELEEEYQVSDEISRDLGSEDAIKLISGNYEIKDNGESYIINIRCH